MFLLLVVPLTAVLVPSASPQALCGTDGQLGESSINDILEVINKKRKRLTKGLIIDAGGNPLPEALRMNKLAWDCQLEKDAIAALGSTCSPAPTPAAADPTKNAGLFFSDPNSIGYPAMVAIAINWLNEAEDITWPPSAGGEVQMPAPPVGDDVKNFANLMRYDTQKIGCAQLPCPNDKTFVFCLTDKPELANPDKIYDEAPAGTGGCKTNGCTDTALGPNTQCDEDLELCEAPPTTTAATTTAATTAASTAATTAATTAASTAATTGVTTGVTTKATDTTTAASYPGELPTGTSSQCTGNVGMTDELRMHFLDTQNYRRSILAKGQVPRPSGRYLPNGANIIKLKLNCNLEKEAIEEVRQCPAVKTPHSTYGKNFDTFASSTATSTYRDAIKKAVTNWWKVSRTENNGPGMQVTFRSNHVNQPVETYTQIAWANTKDIGCAIAKCPSSYTVICLYEPKGNIVDQAMYQIGSPCTACPSGTTCDSALGLCVQNP